VILQPYILFTTTYMCAGIGKTFCTTVAHCFQFTVVSFTDLSSEMHTQNLIKQALSKPS